jgi:hypothetical protein
MRQFLADAGGFHTTMEVVGMTAGMNTKPGVGRLGKRRARDHEEIPIGSLVKTPTGRFAVVVDYKGYGTRGGPGRPHRVWLVCRYEHPVNKKFDFASILPELVEVLRAGPPKEVA